tara:strand:- start:150 stop:338 length:189 start_codon:yes stop_codon:yes gene_type:complete
MSYALHLIRMTVKTNVHVPVEFGFVEGGLLAIPENAADDTPFDVVALYDGLEGTYGSGKRSQ